MDPATPAELTIQVALSRGVIFAFWWAILALAVYSLVGQVLKPGLRLWVTRKRKPAPEDEAKAAAFKAALLREAEVYKYIVRVVAVVLGAAMGFIPIWPTWMPIWGGMLAGLSAGTFSTTMYAIVKDRLPGWADKLGGAAIHAIEGATGSGDKPGGGDSAIADTDTFDILPPQ